MEHSVDDVIGKLSEIEATSVRIMEAADEKKKVLAAEMEEKRKEFDTKLAEQTEVSLQQVKEKLNREKEEELAQLQQETQEMLEKMQQKYENEHGAWSEGIMQSIVRM